MGEVSGCLHRKDALALLLNYWLRAHGSTALVPKPKFVEKGGGGTRLAGREHTLILDVFYSKTARYISKYSPKNSFSAGFLMSYA